MVDSKLIHLVNLRILQEPRHVRYGADVSVEWALDAIVMNICREAFSSLSFRIFVLFTSF